MTLTKLAEGPALVAAVRQAAAAHSAAWEAMVPDQFRINPAAEPAEEKAFAAMAQEKAALRAHVCATYGVTIRELAGLAMQ